MQRIQNIKFKQKCAIKLVNTAFEKTKWRLTSDLDPNYLVILKTLKEAVALGIIEILRIYMKFFRLPLHSKSHSDLLRVAIENRQDKIFNFLLQKSPMCKVDFFTDKERLNSLHMVAKLRYCPKITSIAGEAFQMQRELQWFKVCLNALLTTLLQIFSLESLIFIDITQACLAGDRENG